MEARITITECTDDSALTRALSGRWWWQTYLPHHGVRAGFARTEQRAKTKAEKAARDLAATPVRKHERYNYPLA